MDLIGPLTTTKRGNKYILTFIDYFSKWPEAIPLQSKEACEVLRALAEIFARNGSPSRIITDNGGEFTSEVGTASTVISIDRANERCRVLINRNNNKSVGV